MLIPRRHVQIATSIALILIIAISLATSFELRMPPQNLLQIVLSHKAKQNGSDFSWNGGIVSGPSLDPVYVINGTATVNGLQQATVRNSVTSMSAIQTEPGIIGATHTARPSSNRVDIDSIKDKSWPVISTDSPVATLPSSTPRSPILALTYDGDGGPKHCRGKLLQKLQLSRPASNWKNGTCFDLPADARCGIFLADKGDNCQANLYITQNCANTTGSYVNSVVFMPEERPIGALWRSMIVRCGVDAPEAGLIDPSVLGSLLEKPGPKGATS